MSSKEKPYVILVAEAIYSKVCEIKKKNPEISNINAIEKLKIDDIFQAVENYLHL